MRVVLGAGRSEASFWKVAHFARVALVVRPTIISAFAFVGDFDAGAAGVAGVAVGLAVDAADRIPEVETGARLVRYADSRATPLRIVQAEAVTGQLLADFAALAFIIGPALVRRDADAGATAIGAAGVVTITRWDIAVLTALAIIVAPAPLFAALTLVGDLDAVAPGIHGSATVGDAVGPTNGIVGKAHDGTLCLTEVGARVTDQLTGAVLVGAALAFAAFAFVGNPDSGAAGLAMVAVGVAVDATDGSPDIGADAQLVAFAFVGDLDPMAPGIFLAAAVGHVVGSTHGVVAEASDVAHGLAGVFRWVADLISRTILVGAALAFTLAFMGDLHPGAAGSALVTIGSAVDAADRSPVGGADARLVGHADPRATTARVVFGAGRSEAAVVSLAMLAAVAVVIGPADIFAFAFVVDPDAGATGEAGVGVGVAVDAADGGVLFSADTSVLAFAFVVDPDAGASCSAGIAVGFTIDAADGSVLGGADAVVVALTAVFDGDAGAAGLASVAVGVAVDAAHGLPLVGATTCLELADTVTDGGAGRVGIVVTGTQAVVGITIMIIGAFIVAHAQWRFGAVTGVAAVLVDDKAVWARFDAEYQWTLGPAFAFVGNQCVGTLSLAAIAVGITVEAAHGSVDLGAHAHVVVLGASALDTDLALGAIRVDATGCFREAVFVAHEDNRTDRDADEFHCSGRQCHFQSPFE